MASSKLSEKDTQTIIRYAKELSNTLNKYGNENTEWEEIRLDMFQALSEKYPDFEEIQNLYADCLYIRPAGFHIIIRGPSTMMMLLNMFGNLPVFPENIR